MAPEKISDGGQVVPVCIAARQVGEHEAEFDVLPGMTIRDLFAAHALVAAASAPEGMLWPKTPENIARFAYKMADAMLAARAGSAAS